MASLTFPSSPSNGDTYTYDGLIYVYNSTKNKWSVQSTTTITDVQADSISTSLSPSANVTYDLGTSEKSFRDLYLSGSTIHLGSQQISSNSTGVILPEGSLVGTSEIGSGSGVTVYANASILPTSGLTSGEMAYTGNAIFITNGSGWYRVAVTNQDPSISLSATSASLVGNNSVVDFTYTASDADGTTPTITVTNSGFSSTSTATIQHFTGNNTIRLTNLSNTDYSGTITVTASDGISTGFGTFTATITATVEYSGSAFPWGNTIISVGTSDTNGLENDTFTDQSTNGYTFTLTGEPTQSAFNPYLENWSVEFDGSSDSLQTQISAIGTNDYTIECWVWTDPSIGNDNGFLALSDSATQTGYTTGTFIARTSTGALYTYQGTLVNQGSNLDYAKWQHIAMTRSSNTSRVFVDGTQVGSDITDNRNISATYLAIGAYYGTSANLWKGFVSNLRILIGTAAYTSNFTPPTEKLTAITDTEILTCQSNRHIDNSSSSHSFTVNGYPKITSSTPFGQENEYNDGEDKGSYYNPNTDQTATKLDWTASQTPGTGDFTIEMWIYPTNWTGSTNQGIWTHGSYSPGIFLRAANDRLDWYGGGNNTGASVIHNKAWTHIAYSRSSGTLNEYVNGTRTASVSWATNISNTTQRLGTDGQSYFPGYISDVRYTHGAALYTGTTLTVPTSPVGTSPASGTLEHYIAGDNIGIFDKQGTATLIPKGTFTGMSDPITTTANTAGIATSSISFNNRPLFITSDSFGVINGDFTVEFWAECNSQGQACVLFDNHPSSYGGSFNMRSDYVTGTNSTMYGSVRGLNFNFSYTVADFLNTPAHWAINCTSNAVKIYLNGTQKYSASCSGSSDISSGIYIGGAAGPTSGYSNLVGIMEGFQITNGTGKYPSAFTAPSQEQGRTYQVTS